MGIDNMGPQCLIDQDRIGVWFGQARAAVSLHAHRQIKCQVCVLPPFVTNAI